MNAWLKIIIILGISGLAFLIEAGVPFLLLVLLIYLEFIKDNW